MTSIVHQTGTTKAFERIDKLFILIPQTCHSDLFLSGLEYQLHSQLDFMYLFIFKYVCFSPAIHPHIIRRIFPKSYMLVRTNLPAAHVLEL